MLLVGSVELGSDWFGFGGCEVESVSCAHQGAHGQTFIYSIWHASWTGFADLDAFPVIMLATPDHARLVRPIGRRHAW